MVDIWNLIQSKQYQAAIEECSRLYRETGSVYYLRSCGIAHFLTKNYTAALKDYQRIIDITEARFQGAGNYLWVGICYWYLNEPMKAVTAFRQSLRAPYADAAGGVQAPALLLYAAERLNDDNLRKEALQIFVRHWRNYQRQLKRKMAPDHKPTHDDFVHLGLFTWPGPIVPLLLGKIDTDNFQKQLDISTNNATMRVRRQCQADFYLALNAIRKGCFDDFKVFMTRCAESPKGDLEDEFYLARWEVEYGFPQPAFKGYEREKEDVL